MIFPNSITRHAMATCALLLSGCTAGPDDFTVQVANLRVGSTIPSEYALNGFGCRGENISPDIHWERAPRGTQSFAVTVYDPDAPTGSGWWHWTVINIPADKTGLPKGFGNQAVTPFGLQVRNDFGTRSWGGPCRPSDAPEHRYVFTVYALRVPKIDLPTDASPAMAGYMLNANAIKKTTFVGKYGGQFPKQGMAELRRGA